MPVQVRADIRQQRHIVATQRRKLGQSLGQRAQSHRIHQQIGAPDLPVAAQHLRRIAPARVFVDGQPHLAQPPRIAHKAAVANQQTIGGDIEGQRRGFM